MILFIAPLRDGIERLGIEKATSAYAIIQKYVDKYKQEDRFCFVEDELMINKYKCNPITCFSDVEKQSVKLMKYFLYPDYLKNLDKAQYLKADFTKASRTTKPIEKMTDKEYMAYQERVLDKKLSIAQQEIIKRIDNTIYFNVTNKGYELVQLSLSDYKLTKAIAFINIQNNIDRYFIEGLNATEEEFYGYTNC